MFVWQRLLRVLCTCKYTLSQSVCWLITFLFTVLFASARALSLLLSLVVNSYDYALFTNIISFNYRFDSLYNNFYRFFFLSLSQSLSCDRVCWLTARVFLFTRVMFFFFFWLMVVAALKFCFCFALVTGRGYQKDTRREKSDNGDFSRTRYFCLINSQPYIN